MKKLLCMMLFCFVFVVYANVMTGCSGKQNPENKGTEQQEEEEWTGPYVPIPDYVDVDENANIPAIELQNSLRVMTFNINNTVSNMENTGIGVWLRRRDAAIHLVKDKLPDILFIEEFMKDHATYFYQELRDLYSVITLEQKAGGYYFLGLLVKKDRIEVVKTDRKWFSDTPYVEFSTFPNNEYIKLAGLCEFKDKKTGKALYAIGAHFVPSGQDRGKCSTLAAKWAAEMAPSTAPVLVMGDLNVDPSESKDLLKPLYDYMDNAVEKARYSDGTDRKTYNRFGSTPYKNLDHIFFRNIECVTFRVVDSPDDYGVEFISDHYPVYSDIIF